MAESTQPRDDYSAFTEVDDDYSKFVPAEEKDDYTGFLEVSPEIVVQEAERATIGAVQALDVMSAPRSLDWSDVNEQMDAERFREAEGLRAQGQPERAAALLNEITPFTTAGQYVEQQRAGAAQGAAEAAATAARPTTPSDALRRGLGPGLSSTMQPVAESAARNLGAATGGALGAAAFTPTPIGLAARLGIVLPLGGALGGAIVGTNAQEALLQSAETPEETQARQQRAAEDFARNPGASRVGAALASAPFFGPSLAQFGRAMAGDKSAIANLGIAGVIGGAMEVGSAAIQGRTADAADIAAGVFSNLIMNEPTRLGRKLGLPVSPEQRAVETAQDGQVDVPIGSPTSEVGTIAGMRELPSGIPRKAPVAETPIVETLAPPTDEQRIATLVEAGMSPEDAAAGLARLKATEAPPAAPAVKTLLSPDTEILTVARNETDLLPRNLARGLEEDVKGVVIGAASSVDRMAATRPDEFEKLYDSFSGTREALRKKYGDEIVLFRAQGEGSEGRLGNWVDVPKAALNFASRETAQRYMESGRTMVPRTVNVDDIIAVYSPSKATNRMGEEVPLKDFYEEFIVAQPGLLKKGRIEPTTPAAPPSEPPTAARASEAPPELPGATSNKEAVVNAERAQRALDPVIKEVAIENPAVVSYAEDVIAADPQRPQRIIDRLRAAPPEERTISLVDGGILLIERTKLRAQRDAALARASRKEGSAMEQAIAQAEFDAAEGQLNAMDQAAQDARSTWGRFGQFWQRSMREDFSLTNLERRARLSKDGPLTEKDIAGLKAIADKAKKAHEDFDIRQKQLELESRQSAIEAKIAEVSGKAGPVDPVVKSLADRIIAKLDVQAEQARKNIRQHFSQLNALGPLDPRILTNFTVLAANRVAKSAIKASQWVAEIVQEFGEMARPYAEKAWESAESKLDELVNAGGGTKKKQVAAAVKKTGTLDASAQQARIEDAIGNRIKEGKPLSSLAPYVNKLQETFIAQGINQRDPLIDAVHGTLQKHDPAITRDDAMEIMSKYGSDYATPLSKDPVKQTRRQVDGEIQQLLKLRDIAAKVPLPKSGPERPTPGPTWRNLIKQVNAAKKKLGVVVTDPETQLKSSQDAIRTRLRNDIEDMTLELETGERPPEKTPAEYTQDMEILKGVRDRIRQTLDEIEGNKQLTDEQRLALTKRSAEESLALWERRLAGETAKAPKQRITSPEIEAIRAKRDAIKAEVEELNAADAVLQENKKAEALVRQIEATEAQLASNAVRVKAQGVDSQLVAEAREQLAAVRAALDTKRANDPQRQVEAIEKAERALEASIKKLDADLQAGNIATRTKPTRLESDRLIYLRAQRDAMNQLRAQLRAEARPRLAADQLAIKMRTTQMLKRAAELRSRIAAGDFAPRTRKVPVDISGDRAALNAQADLMSVDAEFQKLQEQWKLDQMNWVQRRWRNVGQAWDATSNIFLSFDLSTPLQTAFSMASHPIEGVKAVGKGAAAFYQQFIKGSEDYARREAAKIANSTNAKNGLYKAMKLELPSAFGKKREENMASVLEQLADLDAKWAGLPDVVKGLFKLEGRSLVKGAKRLASTPLVAAGRGIKASNAAFETIANTMRARTADAMLARWYGRGRGIPTKQQLELLGEHVNIATGKGGLRSGDSIRRLLFAPNYYLSIIKQLSGYHLWGYGKTALYNLEGKVAKDIATEYVRAIATMGSLYGLNALFGNEVEWDARSKEFGRPKTDRGTAIDLTMGRGAWITAAAQIATGERIQKGKIKDADRKGTALAFVGGRLSRGVSTSLTSAFGEDYRGKPITGADIVKDFTIPLGWRNFDDVLRKEGFTRGSFIQLLNILGVTHNIHE